MDLLELCEFYMFAPRSAVGITSPTLQNLSPNCIASIPPQTSNATKIHEI